MAKNRDGSGRFAKGHSGNPKGRPRKSSKVQRSDAWESALTGIGTTLDKRQYTVFTPDLLNYQEALDLMRGDDVAAAAVEKLPDAAMRAGFELKIQSEDEGVEGTKDLQELIEQKWEDLGVADAIRTTAKYERGFGGGAIILGVNDGVTDLRMPLDISRVRSLDFLTPLEARELSPQWYYANPMAPQFGQVAIWRARPIAPGVGVDGFVSAGDFEIHESRLVRFPGIRVTRRYISENHGWGDSILSRIFRVLRDFNAVWDAAGVIASDFSQSIFKMKDLANIIAQDQDEVFKNRMRALDASRSVVRALIIDEEEEFERKSTPITGLPDLLDRFESRMAAAAGMPVTVLFGRAPAGLNATGESDIRMWYDTVDDWRERKIIPALRRITEILLAVEKVTPDSWCIEGKPLWQPDDQAIAATRKTHAETDKIYLDSGVVYPEEIAHARFGGDSYSAETTIDFEAREKLEALEEKQEAEAEARAKEMLAEQALPDQVPAQPGDSNAEPGADSAKESENDEPNREDRFDKIEKRGSKWVVLSMAGKLLGEHPTEAEAKKHLAAIEAAKHAE